MSLESSDNNSKTMAKNLDEISQDMSNKSIEKKDDNDTSIYKKFLEGLKLCPYVNTDNSQKIPIMEFLNELSMKYNNKEKDINSYLLEVQKNKYNPNFNKCEICHNKGNKYFCKKCSKNICKECSKKYDKKFNGHDLIRLKKLKKEIKKFKKKIYKIIIKFRLTNNKDDIKEEKNISEEKETIEYDIKIKPNKIDVNKNPTIEFNPDIELAFVILEANYNNYFHYENIKRLYKYFKNYYEGIFDKECIMVKIDKEKGKKEYNENYTEKMIKGIIGLLSLVINNKKSPVVNEIQTNEDSLQILVYQIFDYLPLINFFDLFKFFVEKKPAWRYSLNDLLNRPKLKISFFNLNFFLNKILKDNKNDKIYYDDNNKPVKNGIGKLYYANKNIAFEGEIKNNIRNGNGKLYYEEGMLAFDGNWVNDKAEGKGNLYFESGDFNFSYKGNWKNNVACGKGKIYLYEKLYYEGNFINGSMEGKGIMHFESKDEYVDYKGHFKNCFWHGKGTRYYKDGKIMYTGDYKCGKENGKGKYYEEKSREYFVGEFKDGLRTEKGNWYYPDGTIKENE